MVVGQSIQKNCDQQSMCSAGSIKANARPCKTCATVFMIDQWRKINRLNMPKCDGSKPCEPTPLRVGLCTIADVQRNPDVCPKEGVGRDPAPVDIFNPGQDVSLAHTHCTSCHEGDALEMVNPDIGTGICRKFGPESKSPNLNAMPQCYRSNNLVVRSDATSQVCTRIFRPAILYAANSSQSWLIKHNQYAYVTCDVRKSVMCAPDDSEKFEIKAEPASYDADCAAAPLMQQFKCKTETQVHCANACRVGFDGNLCRKGSSCESASSWTPAQARVMTRQNDSSLLGTQHDLSEYDCDPARCESYMCHQLALVS